jgi:hypothetical protein
MICEFCSAEIAEGALACPRCGSPVSKPVSKPAGNPPPGPGPTVEAPAPGPAVQPPGAAPVVQAPVPPRAPAGPVAPVPPADVPLARVEEDFIALAEETVASSDEATAPWAPSGPGGAAPSVAAVADQTIQPGAKTAAQYIPLDTKLTGGYKGPESSSVAGAGEQTADDPFGLNITENAPPVAKEWQSLRSGWRYSRWWNITVMSVGIAILLAGVCIALYFGFIKKSTGPQGSAVGTLREYVDATISSNNRLLTQVSAPGSKLSTDITTLLKGYEKYGIIRLTGFDAKATKQTANSATVDISKFDIELDTEKGDKEKVSVLEIQQPFKLLRTIELININGKWMVKS